MKVKTKSGFTCELSEKKIGSWNLMDMYSGISKAAKEDDYTEVIERTRAMYLFVLGEEGYKALFDHLKDADGVVDPKDMTAEFNEIMTIANSKKSKSSQA